MRRRLAQLLDKLELNLKLLEAYLIVKDPSAPKSAEAFDGLRVKVDSAFRQRRRHLAQLAELHRTVLVTGDVNAVAAKLAEFLQMEGIEVVDAWEPGLAHLFEVTAGIEERMRVTAPSYIAPDGDGSFEVIKQGGAEPAEAVGVQERAADLDAPTSDEPDEAELKEAAE